MRIVLLGSLVLAVGCSRGEPPSAKPGSADAAAPASTAPVTLAPTPSVAPPVLGFSQSLAEGRARGHEKRWPEAVAAFEQALVLEPDNPTVLVELGWAAFNAGDDARAKSADERALAAHPTPVLEAQALYNEGRRLEALGQQDDARVAYERSLAARDNESVQKRLEALSPGDGGALPVVVDAGTSIMAHVALAPCPTAQPADADLRRCLESHERAHGMRAQSTFFMAAEAGVTGLPAGTRLVRFGAREEPRESTLLLLADTNAGVLPLATLGSHGTVTFDGAEKKPGRVWFFRSTQSRLDQNLGGLEVHEETTSWLTVCVLGETPACTLQVPSLQHSKLAYPNLADLDVAEATLVKARIKDLGPPYDHKTTLGVQLDAAGTSLHVTLTSGKKTDVPHGVLGVHAL